MLTELNDTVYNIRILMQFQLLLSHYAKLPHRGGA